MFSYSKERRARNNRQEETIVCLVHWGWRAVLWSRRRHEDSYHAEAHYWLSNTRQVRDRDLRNWRRYEPNSRPWGKTQTPRLPWRSSFMVKTSIFYTPEQLRGLWDRYSTFVSLLPLFQPAQIQGLLISNSKTYHSHENWFQSGTIIRAAYVMAKMINYKKHSASGAASPASHWSSLWLDADVASQISSQPLLLGS